MKKFTIIFLIFLFTAVGVGTYFYINNKVEEKKVEEIKTGWYVEVLTDKINIRKKPDKTTSLLGEVSKGDVFKVEELYGQGSFWVHVNYEDNSYGWALTDYIYADEDSTYIKVDDDIIIVYGEKSTNSTKLGELAKDKSYSIDLIYGQGNFWYKIEYEKEKYGWIANPKNNEYLSDVNNPIDISSPKIKFTESIYYVDSIDDINYDHLEVTDDKEGVKVTHRVFHELTTDKDQYWIQYIATDAVGKTTEKVQKIEFNKRPDESEVEDFSILQEERNNS